MKTKRKPPMKKKAPAKGAMPEQDPVDPKMAATMDEDDKARRARIASKNYAKDIVGGKKKPGGY